MSYIYFPVLNLSTLLLCCYHVKRKASGSGCCLLLFNLFNKVKSARKSTSFFVCFTYSMLKYLNQDGWLSMISLHWPAVTHSYKKVIVVKPNTVYDLLGTEKTNYKHMHVRTCDSVFYYPISYFSKF